MKYVLIMAGWILLTAFLIMERILKIVAILFVFLWDFGLSRRCDFWYKIDLVFPIPIYDTVLYMEFNNIKDFYNFTPATVII